MLLFQNKELNNIFERVVKDKNGVFVRVRFTIIEVNGTFQGRIISVSPINIQIKKQTFLPEYKEKETQEFTYISLLAPILSPFNQFFFFNSQPTRAPSF
ncbi:MAG: hypothetical protein NUV47_03730 [Patescibacteria group bacterium]|nr:hypothetical protein [Patescibacteria group bacterium]